MARATLKKSQRSARFVRREQTGKVIKPGSSAHNDRVVVHNDRVVISRAEYDRLKAAAGEGPSLPRADAAGNVPAVDYMRASIARELIRRRREAGLSQEELAKRANVRQETISRIESGKHTVTQRTMEKIEKAL